MFASELKARAQKLEQEQRERSARERQRVEKEKQAAERHRRHLQDIEEEQSRRRAEQLSAELAAQRRVEEETEHNRGVYLSVELQAVPLDPAIAHSKGIRRAGDKMLLPASLSHSLMEQGAPRNGALLFEVCTPSGASTHAGVLEFSALEGVVALPPKVAACLWGWSPPHPDASTCATDDASGSGAHMEDLGTSSSLVHGTATVSYRRLERGTFVRFQPLSRHFHANVGSDDVREVLERALHTYSTLSEGDILAVEHNGRSYALKVQELQPQRQVSIIDTDMEAEVVPSLETEQYLRRAEQEVREQETQMRKFQQEQDRLAAQVLQHAQQQAEEAAHAAAALAAARSAAAAALPPEPAAAGAGAAPPVAACLFRLPDGARASRRFALDAPVQQLFDFADAQGAGGLAPRSYALVTQFPRRTIQPDASGTLQEVGLAAGQEAFLLEPLDRGTAAGV